MVLYRFTWRKRLVQFRHNYHFVHCERGCKQSRYIHYRQSCILHCYKFSSERYLTKRQFSVYLDWRTMKIYRNALHSRLAYRIDVYEYTPTLFGVLPRGKRKLMLAFYLKQIVIIIANLVFSLLIYFATRNVPTRGRTDHILATFSSCDLEQ